MSSDYGAKRAIADLGFIEAYSRMANLPGNDIWFEAFMEALNRIEAFVHKGYLLNGGASPEELSGFLYDVGFMRGSIWNDKIPYAVSETLKSVVDFLTGHAAWCSIRPEPKEEMLSDHARDVLSYEASEGRCLFRPGLGGEIDATPEAVSRYVQQELGAMDRNEAEQWAEEARQKWEAEQPSQPLAPSADLSQAEAAPTEEVSAQAESLSQPHVVSQPVNPFNPSGKMGRREWTPEQRAAQAERAKNYAKEHPLIRDDQLDEVKADFESGMSWSKIGRKLGCSGGNVRNFLKKHGVDVIRDRSKSEAMQSADRTGGRPSLTEEQIQTIISEKAKGTPSKEIGEMIDRSQHAVDVKYSELKKEGHVPEYHLAQEAIEERKAAANAQRAESMRAYHARREGVSSGEAGDSDGNVTIDETDAESEVPSIVPEPTPPHRLTVAHPDYAGKREDGQVNDDDWPDIKTRLDRGDTRRAIASDYDVELEDLDFFISSNQRREAKQPPGEARAPLLGMAGGAS
jgi:hypothetical protein